MYSTFKESNYQTAARSLGHEHKYGYYVMNCTVYIQYVYSNFKQTPLDQ